MSSNSDEVVLSVKNISKCFEMYEKPVFRLLQMLRGGKRKYYKEFWALKDISFDVHKGECIGIIGRNGAGKSTLLQIITGTLQPLSGTVETKGRIAALLELGSGFNPEFTGHDNIYLNASILGLTKEETDAKYDDIVKFADIGDFIDQPVKTYSSGMMVRLAFAVQVMVEPDILIVDEALAVGDALFQRKCYGHIDKLLKRGTAILLVTHDMETIKQRCDHVLFIRDGVGKFFKKSADGVLEYLRYMFPQESPQPEESQSDIVENATSATAAGTRNTSIEKKHDAYVLERKNLQANNTSWGIGGGIINAIRVYGLLKPNILITPCRLSIEIDAIWNPEFIQNIIAEQSLDKNLLVGIQLSDVKHNNIFGTNTLVEHVRIDPLKRKSCTVSFSIDLTAIRNGNLFLTVALSVGNMDRHQHLVWDDLNVVLQVSSEVFVAGFVQFPTSVVTR